MVNLFLLPPPDVSVLIDVDVEWEIGRVEADRAVELMEQTKPDKNEPIHFFRTFRPIFLNVWFESCKIQ